MPWRVVGDRKANENALMFDGGGVLTVVVAGVGGCLVFGVGVGVGDEVDGMAFAGGVDQVDHLWG